MNKLNIRDKKCYTSRLITMITCVWIAIWNGVPVDIHVQFLAF